MMRSDTLNWHDYGSYTEMNDLYLNVYSADEDESKRIIVHEGLSQSCSSNEDKSKRIIVHKKLSEICPMNENESKRSIVNKTISQNY